MKVEGAFDFGFISFCFLSTLGVSLSLATETSSNSTESNETLSRLSLPFLKLIGFKWLNTFYELWLIIFSWFLLPDRSCLHLMIFSISTGLFSIESFCQGVELQLDWTSSFFLRLNLGISLASWLEEFLITLGLSVVVNLTRELSLCKWL